MPGAIGGECRVTLSQSDQVCMQRLCCQENVTLTEEKTPQAHEQNAMSTSAPPPNTSLSTRRGFLGNAGRKAAYVTPAVMTLAAQQAAAFTGFQCDSQMKQSLNSVCDLGGPPGKDCCPIDMATGVAMECRDNKCQEPL